jgi:hypothetical protein
MMPRLGNKYEIGVKITAKTKAEYLTDECWALDLPVAPAIMVGEEIVTEGKDGDDYTLEASTCNHLKLPEPVEMKKGFMDKFFR